MSRSRLYRLSFFFFSSRRRHTRCLSDWSSDVCSSDLLGSCWSSYRQWRPQQASASMVSPYLRSAIRGPTRSQAPPRSTQGSAPKKRLPRSEERRVGKEGRHGWKQTHKRDRSGEKERDL